MQTMCGCGHDRATHNHETDFCKVEDCGCCEFISDIKEWREAKARWDYEDAEDARIDMELFWQENADRKARQEDNDPSSGSTDLGNRGGTTFCY